MYQTASGTVVSLDSLDNLPRMKAWASARFGQALLFLADLTPPLRPLARPYALLDPTKQVLRGAAVRFEGFHVPILSVAADDSDAFLDLLGCVRKGPLDILVVNGIQELPADLLFKHISCDAWLMSPCSTEQRDNEAAARPLTDAAEFHAFVTQMGMRFWCPAMFGFGSNFGVRSAQGELVCVVGVNFVLPEMQYAQIGPVVTHPEYRGHGWASVALNSVRASLVRAGIQRCGVFADASNAGLVHFYSKLGFTHGGEFCFYSLPGSVVVRDQRRGVAVGPSSV